MPRLRLLPALATVCILLAGCNEPPTIGLEPGEAANAPTRIQLDGRELTLEAYLWRDFMPVAPPNGQPLVAVLRVRTANGTQFPAGVTADLVSVLYDGQVWAAPAVQEHPGTQPNVLEVVARDGPKWGPHVYVDVVVRLRDAGGQTHLLRAPNQLIGRTD